MTTDSEQPKTPAQRLIARFGILSLAAWSGRDRRRVHAWCWPMSRGGTDGAIPRTARKKIIDGAATIGVTLTHADFEPQEGEAYLSDEAA